MAGHRRRESIKAGEGEGGRRGGECLRDAGRVAVAPGGASRGRRRPFALELVAQPPQRLAPAAPGRSARPESISRPRSSGFDGSVQRDTDLGQRPGASVSSHTVSIGIRFERPPRPRSTILWGGSSSVIAVSIQTGAATGRTEAGAGTDPVRVDPRQVKVVLEAVGEGRAHGQVRDQLEGSLPGTSSRSRRWLGPSARAILWAAASRAAARFAAHPESGRSLRQNPDARPNTES